MDNLLAFLRFELFISQPVLIVFYYLGALGIPLLAGWMAYRFRTLFPDLQRRLQQQGKLLFRQLPRRYQIWMILFFMLAFLFMNLIWRMMFEYLLAFMQMRDALTAT
jgi:hypothetical protein